MHPETAFAMNYYIQTISLNNRLQQPSLSENCCLLVSRLLKTAGMTFQIVDEQHPRLPTSHGYQSRRKLSVQNDSWCLLSSKKPMIRVQLESKLRTPLLARRWRAVLYDFSSLFTSPVYAVRKRSNQQDRYKVSFNSVCLSYHGVFDNTSWFVWLKETD